MKKICNNMIKVCAFLLLAVGTAQPIQAADPAAKQPLVYEGGQQIKVGDSIMINLVDYRVNRVVLVDGKVCAHERYGLGHNVGFSNVAVHKYRGLTCGDG